MLMMLVLIVVRFRDAIITATRFLKLPVSAFYFICRIVFHQELQQP